MKYLKVLISVSVLAVLAIASCKEANRAPGAPTISTATAGDGEVTVSWTAPTDTGITGDNGTEGVITKYTVYWGTSTGFTKNANDSKNTTKGTASSLIIDNLVNTTTYYFIVTAWNDTGESAISAEESATPSASAVADSEPGAPTILNPDAGDGQVTVNWTAPTDTGIVSGTAGTITKYTVYWGTAAGVTIANKTGSENTTNGTASSLVIDNLVNTTTYYFIVTAWNDTGESAISSEKSATPSDTVIPVTGVTITQGDTANVTMGNTLQLNATVLPNDASVPGVNWSSSDDNIATVSNTGLVEPVSASNDPVTITATSKGQDADNNTISDTIAVTVKAANRAPGAPTITTVTPEAQQVTVEWTAPGDLGIINGDGTTGTITGYTVYWGTAANVTTAGSSKGAGSGATSLVIDNLTKGTAYYFIVTATNGTGESVASGEQGTVTLTTVPSAPTNVQVSAGNAEVTVSWEEPTDTGGATITGYTVYWKTSTGVTTADNDDSAAATTSPHTITGLANGTEVFVIVTAANAEGEGAASGEASATPVEANRAPGAPTISTATAGDGEVTVSWTAPNDTGITGDNGTEGVITKYTVYWGTSAGFTKNANDSKATTNGTTYSLVIDSLINTTTYYFIVTATNGTGESAISDEESATPVPVKPLNTETFSYASAVETDEGTANTTGVTPAWDGNPDTTGITYSITGTTANTDGTAGIPVVAIDTNTGKITITATAVEANSGDYTVEATAGSSSNYLDGSKLTATATVTVTKVYSVGDTGPAGGIVFHDKGSYTDGWRYLEAAPSDETSPYAWGANSTTGVTGAAIGDGEANTATIVAKLQDNGNTDYAAKICSELVVGGKDDWFLPSEGELTVLFNQRSIVGLSSTNYWSSTEDGRAGAWGVSSSGSMVSYAKGNALTLRAVRSF